MAILLPKLFSSIRLIPASGQAAARDKRGMLLTRRVVEPAWRGKLTTGELSLSEHQDLAALIIDVVDRNDRVDLVHPQYAAPRAYAAGGWPLGVDPVLASVTHGRQIVVTGLQLGTTLKRGDRFTIIQGELRCYRFVRTDTTVVSATAQALPLSPRMPIGVFSAGAVVRFINPPVRLAIVPDSYDIESLPRPSGFSFDVEEALA